MMKKDMKVLLGIIIVAGAAVLGYMIWERSQTESAVAEPEPVMETPAEEEVAPSTSGASGGGGSTPSTFEEAYHNYAASGFRIEFAGCSGRPGKLTMKKGTKFMLDNRDNEAHTFVVGGGATYNIGAYGFAIATANTVGTHKITCDGGGAAEIVVQP